MKTYRQLKREHTSELEDFQGIFYAFSQEQFKEGCENLGIDPKGAKAKLARTTAGGFILKERIPAFVEMFKRQAEERNALKKNRKRIKEALVYELINHEFSYTGEIEPALEALCWNEEDIPDDILRQAKKEACKPQLSC